MRIQAHGSGIEIVKLCNSSCSFSSSYSMLTSHVPSPDGVGQQLTSFELVSRAQMDTRRRGILEIGTKLSSLLTALHRKTPNGLPTGQFLPESFSLISFSRPAPPERARLGWYLNWSSFVSKAGEVGSEERLSLTRVADGEEMSKLRSPFNSKDLRPPDCKRVTERCSLVVT
jgi:hypothetical protein